MSEHSVDVCVIGAGAAGIACAQGLARQGASVVLLDRLHPMPDCLKAEKIGGEGVLALLRLGFQPAVDAALTPLRNVSVFFGKHALGTLRLDPPEAGLLYHDFINNLRKHLDARVDFRPGMKAVAFEEGPDRVEVVTGTDARISCRLVVLATGDARHLVEPLGAVYEPQMPFDTFVAAFTFEGDLAHKRTPVDTLTFHHPVADGPIAYATFFRLGNALRANIFCPGPVSEEWQRDLKQRPLDTLVGRNRTLAEAARSWRVVSPVMIRKLRVARMQPAPVGRIVVLGDAAHTIDPSGGGGLNFALLEAELLLGFYAPRWLQQDVCDYEAIQTYYNDPRRVGAVEWYFNRGRYIFDLNHDLSLRGRLRRLRFALSHMLTSRLGERSKPSLAASAPWHLPAPYLYEQYQ
ncbi:MAG: FAD-dependent oxidoreductase [Chloroflexia bacterium]